MKVAFLFPGQGAQKVGMGRDLFDSSEAARAAFVGADKALGEPLSTLIFEGPEDRLTLTANTQPAILTVSLAALGAFLEKIDVAPDFVAGHSLGEFSALVAAGAMAFEDAVRVTRARGTFMQEAVPPDQGAMAAILGDLSAETIVSICEKAREGEIVSPANFNAPGQVVISGHRGAVERACAALTEAGAKKVVPLEVSAPFHCALMEPAAKRLETVLRSIPLGALQTPVVTNVEASPNRDAGRVIDLLVRQVTAPVRWVDSMRMMLDAGVRTFIEFGPGNVLAGLLKRIDKSAQSFSVSNPGALDKAVEAVKNL